MIPGRSHRDTGRQPVIISKNRFFVGDTAIYEAPSGDSHITVITPDQIEMKVPVRAGVVSIELTKPGTWSYLWSDGVANTVEVVDRPFDHTTAPLSVDVIINPELLPPMTVTRKPRF